MYYWGKYMIYEQISNVIRDIGKGTITEDEAVKKLFVSISEYISERELAIVEAATMDDRRKVISQFPKLVINLILLKYCEQNQNQDIWIKQVVSCSESIKSFSYQVKKNSFFKSEFLKSDFMVNLVLRNVIDELSQHECMKSFLMEQKQITEKYQDYSKVLRDFLVSRKIIRKKLFVKLYERIISLDDAPLSDEELAERLVNQLKEK